MSALSAEMNTVAAELATILESRPEPAHQDDQANALVLMVIAELRLLRMAVERLEKQVITSGASSPT